MTEDSENTELKDVAVDTLGLVTHGANRERFFLLKSAEEIEEANQMLETDQSQVKASVAKNIWRNLTLLFKREIEEELADLPVLIENEHVVELPVVEKTAPEAEITEEVKVAEEVESFRPTVESAMGAVIETLIKEKTDMKDEKQVVEKSALEIKFEALEKANTDLQVRVEKAEQEAAQERDAKEYQVWLTKARDMYALPASPDTLAEQLHWLAKADATRAQWWEGHLVALTNQLRDSELFIEKGTSRAAQDGVLLIEKAQKLVDSGQMADLRTAILSLSRAEQEAYLNERRRAQEVA